MEGGLRVGNNP